MAKNKLKPELHDLDPVVEDRTPEELAKDQVTSKNLYRRGAIFALLAFICLYIGRYFTLAYLGTFICLIIGGGSMWNAKELLPLDPDDPSSKYRKKRRDKAKERSEQ